MGRFRPAPPSGTGTPSRMPTVDLTRLEAQTAGDADLQREVLGLFLEALPDLAGRLRAGLPPERRALAHQILGTARALGADEVARQAAAVEAGTGDVAALIEAMEEAGAYVRAWLVR